MMQPNDERRLRSNAGFTMLEMIAALALIALAVGIILPRFGASRQAMTLRSTAVELSSGLKNARAASRVTNADVVLLVDTSQRSYSAAGAVKPTKIPRDVALRFEVKAAEAEGTSRGGFRFRPDGTASGGNIVLRSGRDTATISVDWLTGAVTLNGR